MSPSRSDSAYDVVIAGAGIAGCAAAILYGQRGLRVALVDRRPDPAAHKVVCTHLIQSSALSTFQRLGLRERLEPLAAHVLPQAWTPWGWISPPQPTVGGTAYDWNIRRETLDPILRETAGALPTVDLLLGESIDGVLGRPERIDGLVTRGRGGVRRRLRGRLTVAADGRGSKVAEYARRPGRVLPHRRSSFWAYYEGIDFADPGRFLIWFLNPEFAAIFPTDGGLALVACMVDREHSPRFKQNLEANVERRIRTLPDAPPIDRATRVSPFIGKLDMPNVSRPAAGHGLAFVGDAALASDPLYAVGCGWALQSADWIVEETAEALADGQDLEPALRSYRRLHRRRLLGYHLANANYSTGRRFNPIEALLLSAAVKDERMAAHFGAYGSRNIGVGEFLGPGALASAASVNLRARLRAGRTGAAGQAPSHLPVERRPAAGRGT